MIYKKI